MGLLRRPVAGATLGEVIALAAAFFALYAVLAGEIWNLNLAGRLLAAGGLLAGHAVLTAAVYPATERLFPPCEAPPAERRAVKAPPRFHRPSWARSQQPDIPLRERMLERWAQYL